MPSEVQRMCTSSTPLVGRGPGPPPGGCPNICPSVPTSATSLSPVSSEPLPLASAVMHHPAAPPAPSKPTCRPTRTGDTGRGRRPGGGPRGGGGGGPDQKRGGGGGRAKRTTLASERIRARRAAAPQLALQQALGAALIKNPNQKKCEASEAGRACAQAGTTTN